MGKAKFNALGIVFESVTDMAILHTRVGYPDAEVKWFCKLKVQRTSR